MQTYRAIDTLTVGEGTVLELTEAQAKTRAHKLQSLGESRYQATDTLQFKRGETVKLDGELPKGHERYAECLDGTSHEAQPVQTSAEASRDAGPGERPAAPTTGKKKRFFGK